MIKILFDLFFILCFSPIMITCQLSVVVIGGSGRVGGSALRSLHTLLKKSQKFDTISFTVAGRHKSKWLSYQSKYPNLLKDVAFLPLNISNCHELRHKLKPFDLIINTAGPFQELQEHEVLLASLELGKKYIDVCDDIELSRIALSEKYQQIAKSNNGVGIISTGIWPGCSSLLAKDIVEENGGNSVVDRVEFSFFTAGSGGAGPTILTATFLILGADVLTYEKNQPVFWKTGESPKVVDFGPGIGKRRVALMNLIESESSHASGVASTTTRFGTAPVIWNALFQLMTRLIPQEILRNRDYMNLLGIVSLPMVRLVDGLVGSANSIRIDVFSKDERLLQTAILSHADLEDCVGLGIGLFALELINGEYSGVMFPEDIDATSRKRILAEIAETAIYYNRNHRDL